MNKNSMKYSDHFETIVALISNMALMTFTSRTPSKLAKFLALDSDEVNFVLKNFKGIFRESIRTSPDSNEKYYCLQIRFATRKQEEDENTDADVIQLKAEYLNTLLEFVTKMVEGEKASERQTSINVVTLLASIIALVASIGAAIIAYTAAVR